MGARKKGTTSEGVPVRRRCGAMQVYHRLLETHASYRTNQHDLEHATARRHAVGLARRSNEPLVIAVVVHIVHHTTAENISDAQVKSQIDVLNEDYRAKNGDSKKTPPVFRGLVEDAGIEFALATKDPSGAKSSGIVRVSTNQKQFADDDSVKSSKTGGSDPWPTDRFLNIWVCNLGGGLLGYAQFPGGPAKTDGVVILYRAFGKGGSAVAPYNLGRTTTHEVGHWLNLRHIWGDTEDCSGSDLVSDTPNAAGPNYGKPTFPHITCGNGPSGDMFMNYMDYVDDDSMFMFTPQQVVRMHAALENARPSIGGGAVAKRRARGK